MLGRWIARRIVPTFTLRCLGIAQAGGEQRRVSFLIVSDPIRRERHLGGSQV
jgi:hypothetical protein